VQTANEVPKQAKKPYMADSRGSAMMQVIAVFSAWAQEKKVQEIIMWAEQGSRTGRKHLVFHSGMPSREE